MAWRKDDDRPKVTRQHKIAWSAESLWLPAKACSVP